MKTNLSQFLPNQEAKKAMEELGITVKIPCSCGGEYIGNREKLKLIIDIVCGDSLTHLFGKNDYELLGYSESEIQSWETNEIRHPVFHNKPDDLELKDRAKDILIDIILSTKNAA